MTAATATRAPGPAAVPDSLSDLAGPAEGEITLPVTVCWYLADRTFDLGDTDDLLEAYEAVLGNGTLDDARTFLNAGRLVKAWPLLRFNLSRRDAWERKHPELRRGLPVAA